MKLLNGCQAKPGRQAPAVKRFLHPLVFQAVTYARPVKRVLGRAYTDERVAGPAFSLPSVEVPPLTRTRSPSRGSYFLS